MTITAINNQQKNKDRVNIFIDGRFAFGLHIEVVLDQRIKVGMEVSDDQISAFKIADAFRHAYDKALNYLASRPRSSHEVYQYLRNKLIYKHPDYGQLEDQNTKEIFITDQLATIDQIIDKLSQSGYLDDIAFAKWWISNRQAFRPRGKRLLLLELKAKGLSNADIHEALTTPSEEGHFTSEREDYSELDSANELAQKYIKKHANLPAPDLKQKLSRYLASKGYEWDTIKEVVNSVVDSKN